MNIHEAQDAKRQRADRSHLRVAAHRVPPAPRILTQQSITNTVNQGIAARLKSIYTPYDVAQ